MGGADHHDTIAALSSGRPPAAISVIRCSGPLAMAVAERLGGSPPAPRKAALKRLVDPASRSVIDDAIVLAFPGPHSATGEDIVEFQCHGGRATVDALLTAIVSQPGCRVAEPGEFTRRALANGRIDLTEAEGLADLLEAETELQRRSALARAGGAFRRQLDDWRDRLLALSAQAEVAIDYADEDDGAGFFDFGPAIEALRTPMAALLNAPRVEPLRDGIRVVIAGPPNAGKSSLLNAITQSDRSIVTDIPGTTRDVIEVPVSLDGIPYVFIDTAGLRQSDDVVEGLGIRRAQDALRGADIILWMGDVADLPSNGILLSGKADTVPRGAGIAISSVSGEGLPELLSALRERAESLLPKGDELALDRRHRALIGEAAEALERGFHLRDPVLIAEELRVCRAAIDAISGRSGVEDLLDALFGRFCLGK